MSILQQSGNTLPNPPRLAFCTDTFLEPNGVATCSRHFAAFAQRRQLPFLLVRPGNQTRAFFEGSSRIVELAKSSLALPLDMGLKFDLLHWRHAAFLRQELLDFAPDILHITGPGDIGMLAARLSHTLSVPKVPLVASWHTNLHQYARLRADGLLRLLPQRLSTSIGRQIERNAFRASAAFYRSARLTMAPNAQILEGLTRLTKRPGFVMPHGVDTELFHPAGPAAPKRPLTLGYVGRLTAEKNVSALVEIHSALPATLRDSVRWLVVGDGSQRDVLARHLPNAEFTGILTGESLADAFRRMDLFLFPSRSDTFGLVLLEAMASGLPVVAFELEGPARAVEHNRTGYLAPDTATFAQHITQLAADPQLRISLAESARQASLLHSWDCVFESIYEAYKPLLPGPPRPRPQNLAVYSPVPATRGR